MKKLFSFFVIVFLIFISPCLAFASEKLSIVATIFPVYDWVKEILGSNAEDVNLTLLLDDGVDLHSYQPTVEDMVKISTCDIFIYVGGESDEWVNDALKNSTNNSQISINLLSVLGSSVKTEEIIEGMQHEHEDHEEHEHEHEHEAEIDEHIWLSVNYPRL